MADIDFLSKISDIIRTKKRIDRYQAEELWRTATFNEIGLLADLIRKEKHPDGIVTYLIDRNINYTNVCNTDCTFCGFYRPSSNHPEAYVLSKDILTEKINETIAVGGTRILLQGGHNDDLNFDYYVDLISWIKSNFNIEINAFSPSEIIQMRKVSGLSIDDILNTLKDAGMSGLPGGGGEILDDEIRAIVSPKKINSEEWLSVMEVAQKIGLTTTATMVFGFGERIEHRLNHLQKLRDLQDKSQSLGLEGFNSFISWPLQHNEATSIGRSKRAPTLGAEPLEYLKNIALSRIFLDNILNHQASWPSCGPEIAAIGLHMGCNDFGSTMLEENVVSKAGGHTATEPKMMPEQLIAHIRQAGFIPAQRDTSFNILRVHRD